MSHYSQTSTPSVRPEIDVHSSDSTDDPDLDPGPAIDDDSSTQNQDRSMHTPDHSMSIEEVDTTTVATQPDQQSTGT
jgi:hypothetical protein